MVNIIFPQIDLSIVKGVLIDLDNTLYAYDPCHRYALDCCYKEFNWNMPFETFIKRYRSYRNKVTTRLSPQGACRSRLFAFQNFLEDMHIPASYVKAKELDEIYWKRFLAKMVLADDAKRFLKECNDVKVPVCIVSDMTASIQIDKIKNLDITGSISHLVTSEEAGTEKPDNKIFKLALSKLGITAPQAIMVGDSYEKDILGAENFGIRAYQISLQPKIAYKQGY